jgi:peptide/nickel transport system ATP-binding protein
VRPVSHLLEVRDLSVIFSNRRGAISAVRNVSFDVTAGEVLGIVGESGAGKSLTSMALLGLIDEPGRVEAGAIRLRGERIDNLPPSELRRVRGRQIGIIFQDPLTSLDPLFTIGDQLVETIRTQLSLSGAAAEQRAIELLREVGIPAPEKRFHQYPHQLSGGMRQRVVIALAICADPALVVADEPTTALDVSVQAQIIALLKRLCRERGTSIILVTHDMGVIAEAADRVAVMYAGRIVEIGATADILKRPLHPYTQGLMGAIPRIGKTHRRLLQISGTMPRPGEIFAGCAFAARCGQSMSRCCAELPQPIEIASRKVACFRAGVAHVGT